MTRFYQFLLKSGFRKRYCSEGIPENSLQDFAVV
jgi:hypothetical protein